MRKYKSSIKKVNEKLGYDFRIPRPLSDHEDDRPEALRLNYDRLNDEDRKFIGAWGCWKFNISFDDTMYTEADFLEE